MSPFPRFEIPKMSEFRTNTDSSSIIIDGECLLESSLHPTPLSLKLDFHYKEKKKRDRIGNSGGNNGTDTSNQRLFYFAILHAPVPGTCTVLYFCQKLFSSHLSRNYRYLYCKKKHDVFTNTENSRTFCTEIFSVNHVLTPTNSYGLP